MKKLIRTILIPFSALLPICGALLLVLPQTPAHAQDKFYRVVTEETSDLSVQWSPITPNSLPHDDEGYPIWTKGTGDQHFFRTRLVETDEDGSHADKRQVADLLETHKEPVDYAVRFFETLRTADLASGVLGGQWVDAKIAPVGYNVFDPAVNDGVTPAYFELKIIPDPSANARSSTREEAWAKVRPFDNGEAADRGYIMVSLGEQLEPVVEYSYMGKTPVEELAAKVSEAKFRPMRFGAGFLAAESLSGQLLGSFGVPPRLRMGGTAETPDSSRNRSSESDFSPIGDLPGEPVGFDTYVALKDAWKSSPQLTDARLRRSAAAKIAWDVVGAKVHTFLKLQPGESAELLAGRNAELHSLDYEGESAPVEWSELRNGGIKVSVLKGAPRGSLLVKLKIREEGRAVEYVDIPVEIGGQRLVQNDSKLCFEGTFFGNDVEICHYEHGVCIRSLEPGSNLIICEFKATGDHFPVYAPASPDRLLCGHTGRGVAAWSSLLGWWDRNGFATHAYGYPDLSDAPFQANDERVDALQEELFAMTGSVCPSPSDSNLPAFGPGATPTTSMHKALDLFPPRLQSTRVGYQYSDLTSTSPGAAAKLAVASLRDGRPSIIAQDDSRYWITSRCLSYGDQRSPFGMQTHFWSSMGAVGSQGAHVVYSKFISSSEIIFACDAKFWNRN